MGLADSRSLAQGRRRVGLFGGSFDPVHLAHLSLARCALTQLALDELRWVPAGAPWQKAGSVVADASQREAMVRLMLGDESGFVLDRCELQRQGSSYTIDTVDAIMATQPGCDLFLLLGQDQLARLPTWHRWRELLGRVRLAVAARAGEAVWTPDALAALGVEVIRLEMPSQDISSSAVRALAARGEDIRPMVGEAVARYIACHGLYQARQQDPQADPP